jgi:hypothetical protein
MVIERGTENSAMQTKVVAALLDRSGLHFVKVDKQCRLNFVKWMTNSDLILKRPQNLVEKGQNYEGEHC